jgi:amino-acid N-acetyltransferase
MMLIASGVSRSAAVSLLESADLPTTDLDPRALDHFLYAGPADAPVGLVGLEIYDDVALLRSLVVAPGHRGSGLGGSLVEHAERYAADRGVRTIYLLTTTAEAFFGRRGYEPAPRTDAPEAIQRTAEFSTLCPSSSAFMRKRVAPAR